MIILVTERIWSEILSFHLFWKTLKHFVLTKMNLEFDIQFFFIFLKLYDTEFIIRMFSWHTNLKIWWFGRMALKHVYYQVRNESPVYVWCRIQHAWGWCMGMTQRDVMGREVGGGSCLGLHVHPWWIHVNVWQNQYSIVK